MIRLESLYQSIPVEVYSAGLLATPDEISGIVYRNGTATAVVVTYTPKSIGRYWASFTTLGEDDDWEETDRIVLETTVEIDGEDYTTVSFDSEGHTNGVSTSSVDEMVEIVEGVPRFTQSALAQVVRWVAGPVLPNEPYPPIRRLGTRDLTLFNGENLPAMIPLEHLDSETLSTIEGEELRFVVETSKKIELLSQLLTVENGSILVPSTADITTKKQSLLWSLRWPDTNAYITGGRITVAYAPINQQ